MKRIKRRTYRKQGFKATKPVAVLLVIIGFLCWGFYNHKQSISYSVYASSLEQQIKAVENEKLTAEQEKQLLEEKLARSQKIATSDTTKQIVRFYIKKYFPESEWATAEKVSTCESNMNPASINDKNTNLSTDRGAWQINSVHAKRFEQMYGINYEIGAHDVDISTKYAKFLWDHSGWAPWVCYEIIQRSGK